MKRLLCAALALLFLAGCGAVQPAQEAIVPPEGMLLPFDSDGQLVWDASDIDSASVDFTQEGEQNQAITARLSGKDLLAFAELLNGMDKTLAGREIQAEGDNEAPFDGIDRGGESEMYFLWMNTPEYILLSVHQAEDCGYLWFRRDNNDYEDMHYYYSLYRISPDALQALARFFEGLEKRPEPLFAKPVLYLYPARAQDVRVTLDFDGQLTATYPAYHGGWHVRAFPGGRLINHADGLEYSYLFWEGLPNSQNWDFSEGYCVAGADTARFLRQKLGELGLVPREYNEMIVFWLPQMQGNPYNLITFQREAYEKSAPLTITPAPDAVLRVFMVFAPLEEPVDIMPPAAAPAFTRAGFTAVEWGGAKAVWQP